MKVMLIMGGGGHTSEICLLLDKMGDLLPEEERLIVYPKDDEFSKLRAKLYSTKVYTLPKARTFGESKLRTIYNLTHNTVSAINLLRKIKPNVIITCGPSTAVPISVFGRIFGVHIIYIETISRYNELSLSGKVLKHFAHIFIVQWEPLLKLNPKAVYAGRLI